MKLFEPVMEDVSKAADAPLSVAEFTSQIKTLLESEVAPCWVAGEVSNLARPSSGHCYFTLKDDSAQIRAVMWRGTASKLRFDLEDGMELLCFGRLDVYPPRGSYQLVVSKAEPQGVGALELALRKLRDKLSAEGLFDPGKKRPLAKFPRRIAFVTSPTGAAIRDFLEVLRRRWLGVDVLVVPVRVQGDGAANEIADGIALANRLAESVDTIVVGRGGGSLEDLWCFNEEVVVRAIAKSRVPTVSAVGHEIDVTLADLVADVRALTPSEAAELVAPSAADLRQAIAQLESRMQSTVANRLRRAGELLERIEGGRFFRNGYLLVEDRARRVDEFDARLGRAVQQRQMLAQQQIASLSAQLESLSPVAVLGRGYSVTSHVERERVIKHLADVQPGDEISTRLADGEFRSTVK